MFTGGNAAVWRRRRRCPPAGAKGDRTPMVSCPLLTPLTFLWTRLPSVARLNARGPQGRLVLQGYTLDRSRAFRSGELPLCTGWPRTVMRGKPRKLTSGPDSVPKSARRTEPSPRFPRFAARPKGVAAQRRVWGSQEGAREPYGALFPFCPCRRAPAPPRRRRRHSPAMSWRTSPNPGGPNSPAAASRRNGGTAHPCSREGVKFGAITASFRRRKRTTQPPER